MSTKLLSLFVGSCDGLGIRSDARGHQECFHRNWGGHRAMQAPEDIGFPKAFKKSAPEEDLPNRS